MKSQVIWFDQLGIRDIDDVGGKNASLGEMISNLSSLGVKMPDGFATTIIQRMEISRPPIY